MKYEVYTEIENKIKLDDNIKGIIYSTLKEIENNINIIPGSVRIENKHEPKIIEILSNNKEIIIININSFDKQNIKVEINIKGKNKQIKLFITKNNLKINGYNLLKDGIYFISPINNEHIKTYYDNDSIRHIIKNSLNMYDEGSYKYIGLVPDEDGIYLDDNKTKTAMDFYNGIIPKKNVVKILELKKDNN